MTDFERDRARGAQAFRDGLPFDPRETVGWELGFGDAILITPCPPPEKPAHEPPA